MIKLKDILLEKGVIAGFHDKKETMELLDKIFKDYKVKPKIKFQRNIPKHGKRANYAHYDFDSNFIYINSAMNKNIKDFLLSVVHETWHADQAKKNGGGRKFADKYEMEISQWQADNPSKENDWYKYNKYEIEAEKVAQRDYKKYIKHIDHLRNKNDKVR